MQLLDSLKKADYSFQTVQQYIKASLPKAVILRHDIDRLPLNSLQIAKIQADTGIKGSYYFRIVPESFNESIIKEIASLGHEIGYHYEDVSLIVQRQKTKGKRQKGEGSGHTPHDSRLMEEELAKIAIESFSQNLEKLRKIVPINTICMHGSPMSRWDNRLVWKYYDYHDFGIVGEPYFDINFDDVFYLTDTGRRWNGDSFNVRDKMTGKEVKRGAGEREKGGEEKRELNIAHCKPYDLNPATCNQQPAPFHKFHSTYDIIKAANEGKLPDKIMMTFHPQRWTDKPLPWVKELVWQNVKNVGKYFLIKVRSQ